MEKKTATMLYDGDCGFCTHVVRKWEKRTVGAVIYKPYQEAISEFAQVSENACREAVQLVMPDGSVCSGAHAVFKAMDLAGSFRSLHWLYEHMPFFGRVSEFMYQWIAHHRMLISKLLFGSIKTCA